MKKTKKQENISGVPVVCSLSTALFFFCEILLIGENNKMNLNFLQFDDSTRVDITVTFLEFNGQNPNSCKLIS